MRTSAQQRDRPTGPPRTPYELNHALGAAARSRAPHLGVADNEAIVNATSAVAATGESDTGPGVLAEELGAATESSQQRGRLEFPDSGGGSVRWSAFGALIPIIAGSAGAGASCVAAAATDALQQSGRCVLLVDADDPARSGLAHAATQEGPWVKPGDGVAVRYSWRADALVARLETELPTITPGMAPVPPAWLPDPAPDPLHATVVDLGHGGWRAGASPVYGAGGWLRRGLPAQRPILVVRPTRPSLRQAEALLARLEPWVERGVATPVFQLVVNGARRWPAGVAGAAGPRVAALIDDALFVPHHPGWEVAGVTDEPSPPKAVEALRPLLAAWGLIPSPRRR